MFLVGKFQQFHAELSRLAGRVSHGGGWIFEGASTVGASDALNADMSPTAIWSRLHSLLERQALEAGREGGDVAVDVYRRAQYAMAALADEVFLHLDWAGRHAWRENLLEMKLFNTRHAGEELFERIDMLLRERDSVYSELARVYLTVLALGFQGKYRGVSTAGDEIANYRKRLHRFIFGRDPQAVRGNEPLVPQTYLAAVYDERKAIELPYLRPWAIAITLIVAVWLAASHAVWRDAVSQLEPLVEQIHDLSSTPQTAATTNQESL